MIIHNLSKKHSGTYTCRISVNDESQSVFTKLTVLFAPILQQAENESETIQHEMHFQEVDMHAMYVLCFDAHVISLLFQCGHTTAKMKFLKFDVYAAKLR